VTGAERAGLFAPLDIRGLRLANRIVMSPMNRDHARSGIPDLELAAYFARRAEGETGLIVTGGIAVDHPAASGVHADRPCNIPELHGAARPAWQHVVDLVHAAAGKIVPQLWHQGPIRLAGTGYHPEAESARPSGIWGPPDRRATVDAESLTRFVIPARELTDAEIGEIIAAYARSARDAVAAGFDGIAIHGANGNLPDAFMWEETNRRTDRWGGTRRARSRFAAEVVRAIRREIGEERPIFFRFSQWKLQDLDGSLARTPAELEEVLAPLADAGVDVFDASQFWFDRPEFPGSDLNLAGWAKKVTGRLAMTVGGVGLSAGLYDAAGRSAKAVADDNLDLVARRFAHGEFDLVAVGRALAQDPAWTRKARLGLPFEEFSSNAMRTLT
jgi:2,4-dienoyl-CoA reductase-like NADH-dependent reductase (Old Yellow Enzyme family)